MTRYTSMFIKFDHKERGHITYEDKTRGKILGEGIMRNHPTITIEDFLTIKRLKHNILSVSQSCDNGYSTIFNILSFLIEHKESKSLVFKGSKVDNIYLFGLDDVSMYGTKYLVTKN